MVFIMLRATVLCSGCCFVGLALLLMVELTAVGTLRRAGSIQFGSQAESYIVAAVLLAEWARSWEEA